MRVARPAAASYQRSHQSSVFAVRMMRLWVHAQTIKSPSKTNQTADAQANLSSSGARGFVDAVLLRLNLFSILKFFIKDEKKSILNTLVGIQDTSLSI